MLATVLTGLCAKVAVQRINATGKMRSVVPFSERFNPESGRDGFRHSAADRFQITACRRAQFFVGCAWMEQCLGKHAAVPGGQSNNFHFFDCSRGSFLDARDDKIRQASALQCRCPLEQRFLVWRYARLQAFSARAGNLFLACHGVSPFDHRPRHSVRQMAGRINIGASHIELSGYRLASHPK